MRTNKGIAAAVVTALAMWSLEAAGALVVDVAGDTDDELRSLWLGPADSLYAQARIAENACGLVSLDANGAPNTVFGQNGHLQLSTCASDLRFQSDGSLVFLQPRTTTDGGRIVVRAPSGTLLTTTPPLYSDNRSSPYILALSPDGSYLVGGIYRVTLGGTYYDWLSSKFISDGSPDTTFGTGGTARVSFPVGDSQMPLHSMHRLPDGKILLTGAAGTGSVGNFWKVTAARQNADGSVDASFGANGKVQVDGERGWTDGTPGMSVLDSSGRLYVLTHREGGQVVRILADGTRDSTYDAGSTPLGISVFDTIAIDGNDRVVLFGNPRVARRDTSGNPDVTFNGTGEVVVTMPASYNSSARPCTGVVQSGSRPLIACSFRLETDGNRRGELAFVRLTSAGVEDATFGAGQPTPDSYPDAVNFPSVTVPYGTAMVESPARTPTGFTDPARIVVNGTQQSAYSIGCNGTFTSAPGILLPGQSICLRAFSASQQPGGTASASVDIGGRRVEFTVISGNSPADFVPDSFAFQAQTDVELGATVTSNAVTISGFTAALMIHVTNGSYSVGCGQDFIMYDTQITNGTSVCVRHEAASTPGTSTTTQLRVGSVSAPFTSTTAPPDTTPDAFTFTDQASVPAGSIVVSNAVSITGINADASVSVTGGEFSIGCDGTFTSTAGTIQNGQTVCVRHTAAAAAGGNVTTTLTVGGVSDAFTSSVVPVSSAVDNAPNSTPRSGGGGAVDRLTLSLLGALALFVHLARRRRRGAAI